MLASIGVLLAAAAVTALPSTDPTRARLQIQIQVEQDVALDPSDLRAIASGIRAIWAPMLDVVVSTSAASAPAAVDSIRLVITNRTLDTHDSTGLGWIGFVDGEPQPSVTVSFAAAKRLAESGEWRGVAFSTLPHARLTPVRSARPRTGRRPRSGALPAALPRSLAPRPDEGGVHGRGNHGHPCLAQPARSADGRQAARRPEAREAGTIGNCQLLNANC